MRKESVSVIVLRMMAEERQTLEKHPFLVLKATYVKKGGNAFPKATSAGPWQPRSYF
jgi:hypothetical protein